MARPAAARTLLGAEELDGARGGHRRRVGRPPQPLALAEERRLFYVACTRARRRLVASAVRAALDGPDAECDAVPLPRRARRGPAGGRPPARPSGRVRCGCAALVAELRRAVRRSASTPAPRRAAAACWRRLAGEGVRAPPRRRGTGLSPLSDDAPLVEPGEICGCRRRTSRATAGARCAGCWARRGAEVRTRLAAVASARPSTRSAQRAADGTADRRARRRRWRPSWTRWTSHRLVRPGSASGPAGKLDRFLDLARRPPGAIVAWSRSGPGRPWTTASGRARCGAAASTGSSATPRAGGSIVDVKTGKQAADGGRRRAPAARGLPARRASGPSRSCRPGDAARRRPALVQLGRAGSSRCRAKEQGRPPPAPTFADAPAARSPTAADGMAAATFGRDRTALPALPGRTSCPRTTRGGRSRVSTRAGPLALLTSAASRPRGVEPPKRGRRRSSSLAVGGRALPQARAVLRRRPPSRPRSSRRRRPAGRRRRRRLGQDRDDGRAGGLAGRQRSGRPEEVLGLTFTRKAAGELGRARRGCARPRSPPRSTADPSWPRACGRPRRPRHLPRVRRGAGRRARAAGRLEPAAGCSARPCAGRRPADRHRAGPATCDVDLRLAPPPATCWPSPAELGEHPSPPTGAALTAERGPGRAPTPRGKGQRGAHSRSG